MSVAQIGNNSPVQPYVAQPRDTQSTSNDNSGIDTSADSIGGTFLTLLVQELQNQDPTAPMDSTQMVGQMISLNQLDQLTSINQVLSDAFSSSAPTSSNASGSATPNIAAPSQAVLQAAAANAALNSTAATGNAGQSAF
jgi:flagellar basal-body rod modification protein FlgD